MLVPLAALAYFGVLHITNDTQLQSAAPTSAPPLNASETSALPEPPQANASSTTLSSPTSNPLPPSLSLVWSAPFLSGSGYGSEAISFLQSLENTLGKSLFCVHHGDAVNERYLDNGMAPTVKTTLTKCLFGR